MPSTIRYAPAAIGKQVTAQTVTTSETTLIEMKNPEYAEFSQLSLFIDATLGTSGGNTKISLRYYMSFDGGSTYYQVPIKDLSTGQLQNVASVIDSTSPAKVVEDLPLSGCSAIKVTAQADVGTATVNTATMVHRNN